MPLKIYNSLTRKKEDFVPLNPPEVKMYVCGPTVYDEPHIGHLRSAYIFEVIRNYLTYSGYQVKFVRNVTDVDDKIIEKARSAGVKDLNQEVINVSKKYLEMYKADLLKLGIQEPSIEPKATEHVPQMISLIQKLIGKEAAYESGGDVYFDVNHFKGYGKLSNQKKEAMIERARTDPSEKKKNPLDFALWKKSKEGEPSWPSPWGAGRPGWHIECSAMSMNYLGESFDIHGGGQDLIFPHHENEIAQSEGATGKPFARYWIHHGLVTINGEKMSKSLNNYISLSHVNNLNKQWADNRAMDNVKLLFLGTHYSQPLDYSDNKMKMEESIWMRFWFFFDKYYRVLKERGLSSRQLPNNINNNLYEEEFKKAMNDDFNTPLALTNMQALLKEANREDKSENFVLEAGAQLLKFGSLFEIFTHFQKPFSHLLGPQDFIVQDLVSQRNAARDRGDYVTSDSIRDRLLREHGVEIVDMRGGVTILRHVSRKMGKQGKE